jgi:hypothetical protein
MHESPKNEELWNQVVQVSKELKMGILSSSFILDCMS